MENFRWDEQNQDFYKIKSKGQINRKYSIF